MKRVVSVVQAIAAIAALVFVVMLFANEPDNTPPPAAAPAATNDGDDAGGGDGEAGIDGAALFTSRCAGCHGADGGGGIGPRLSGGRAAERFPDIADQIDVVQEGRGGMPGFAKSLTAEEIRAVVEYTRSK